MKRNLPYIAVIALLALLAVVVVVVVSRCAAGGQKTTPVAQIAPNATLTLAAQAGDTPSPIDTSELTPADAACVPPVGWVLYTVQPDETLSGIAARHNITAEELQQANCLLSADIIQAGQSLYVPDISTPSPTPCNPPADWVLYTVQPGETLYGIVERYGMTVETFQQANCLSSADAIQAEQDLYVPYLITPTPTPCTPPADWVLYTVQPDDSLFEIALRYDMTAEELQQANCLPSADIIQTGQDIYVPYVIPTATPILIPTAIPAPVPIPTPVPVQPPTPVPLPVPIPIPSPIPIPTDEIDLKEEIFFDPGGEIPGVKCDEPEREGSPRRITISDRAQDEYEMCVYGFPMGEEIRVDLFAPDDEPVSSQEFEVKDDFDGSTIVKIELWMPVGVVTGTWSAIAKSGSDEVRAPFGIEPFPAGTPAINTMPEGDVNPFEKHNCDLYEPNDQVIIHGTNFEQNQDLALGIYRMTTERDDRGWFILELARDPVLATTDDQGDFSASVQVESSDLGGIYWVVPVTNPDASDYRRVDAKIQCFRVP